jgi:molybdopterin-containing oxidoreductase family membrane subunit
MSTPPADGAERLRAQMRSTGSGYYALLGAASLAVLWFLFVVWTFLTQGHAVTNLGDWGTHGGVPWGLDIAAFRWWAAMGVGAITLSAVIRAFRTDDYVPYARLGELLALLAFAMAFLHVVFDLGRPDRVWMPVVKHPLSSPIVWDIAILAGLGTMATVLVAIGIRDDVAELRRRNLLPAALGPIYEGLLLGHDSGTDSEDRVGRGLAAVILLYVPLTGGGVAPLLFLSLGKDFDWFGAIQGPTFMFQSLATGSAAVVLIAALLRYGYGWSDVFDDGTLANLGAVVAAFATAYLLSVLFEVQSGAFGPIFADTEVGTAALTGPLAPLLALAAGSILASVAYLAGQRAVGRVSLVATGAVATVLLVGVLLQETWIVVGGLTTPELLYPTGEYTPSWTELSNVLGTTALVTLGYLVIVKVLPVVPVESLERESDNP